jgi:hypothetical protein
MYDMNNDGVLDLLKSDTNFDGQVDHREVIYDYSYTIPNYGN